MVILCSSLLLGIVFASGAQLVIAKADSATCRAALAALLDARRADVGVARITLEKLDLAANAAIGHLLAPLKEASLLLSTFLQRGRWLRPLSPGVLQCQGPGLCSAC